MAMGKRIAAASEPREYSLGVYEEEKFSRSPREYVKQQVAIVITAIQTVKKRV
jgi:hypothetical protein